MSANSGLVCTWTKNKLTTKRKPKRVDIDENADPNSQICIKKKPLKFIADASDFLVQTFKSQMVYSHTLDGLLSLFETAMRPQL